MKKKIYHDIEKYINSYDKRFESKKYVVKIPKKNIIEFAQLIHSYGFKWGVYGINSNKLFYNNGALSYLFKLIDGYYYLVLYDNKTIKKLVSEPKNKGFNVIDFHSLNENFDFIEDDFDFEDEDNELKPGDKFKVDTESLYKEFPKWVSFEKK